ncbi:MAG: succinylarginine dihydrolase [Chlamydiia bacterium]|nr:succinylarginine dihydrolase [Chlamydiia bacterium]
MEVNIDCLAGPTHHFGGLSYGNIASIKSKSSLSHPKLAALQGLEKMKLLSDLGVPQIVLPPQSRPSYETLRSLGFQGSEQVMLEEAFQKAPHLLLMCSSSSAMWTANAATVTPSLDSSDHKVHITPANLAAHLHRSIEATQTAALFKQIFHDVRYFTHHAPLLATGELFDEGAANHTRFSLDNGPGLHFFVYGTSSQSKNLCQKYPARQTKEAQEAISRLHKINHFLFAEQNPKAIDAGVFHNDVIATGYKNIFMLHEDAFVDTAEVLTQLQEMAQKVLGKPLQVIEIKRNDLSLQDAVDSYFFNSQIVESHGKVQLIAPLESKNIQIPAGIFEKTIFIPLQESMKNGGGPACLRLRMQLSTEEFQSIHQGVVFTDTLYRDLKKWIETYYPDDFYLEDLLNPQFRKANEEAHSEILHILNLK